MHRTSILPLLLLALACSKKEAPAEPTPNPEPTEIIAEEDGSPEPQATPPEKPPTVALVSAGSPPHETLRWHFKKGQTQTMTVNIDTSVEMSVDGTGRPGATTPPLFVDVALTVDEIDSNGSALISVNVTGGGVSKTEGFPQQLVAGLQLALARVVGVEGSYQCDPRGFLSDLNFNVPDDATAAVRQAIENMRQSIRLMHAQLPDEPIGKGGEWSVESEFENVSVQVAQRAVYKIKKLRLPVMAADITATQSAGPQTMTGSGGKTAKLKALTAESGGSAKWNVRKLAPASLSNESKMTMEMAATGDDGASRNVAVIVNQTIAIASP